MIHEKKKFFKTVVNMLICQIYNSSKYFARFYFFSIHRKLVRQGNVTAPQSPAAVRPMKVTFCYFFATKARTATGRCERENSWGVRIKHFVNWLRAAILLCSLFSMTEII